MPKQNHPATGLDALRHLTVTAMAVAIGTTLAILSKQVFGNLPVRLDFSVLAVLLVSMLFGLPYGGVTYVCIDVLSSIFFYPPYLPITLCKFLTGLLFDLFLHRARPKFWKTLALFLVNGIVIDCIFMAHALYFLQGGSISALLWLRTGTAAVNIGLFLFFVYGIYPRLEAPLVRLMKMSVTQEKEQTAGEFETYAHSFQVFPRLGLERITALLAHLGNPQNACRCIHIAGTNGKGSVSFALASVLLAQGEKVGLYTSPNLVSVRERIVVAGKPISEEDLARIIREVEVASKAVEAEMHETPTPFEIWTASAFLHFARENCSVVVLETGLGGSFDATNVIQSNLFSILTRIDFDHTAHLGNTLAEITANKCGIFKENQAYKTVLCAPQFPEVKEEISKRAKALGLTPRFVTPLAPGRFSSFYEVIHHPTLGECQLPFAGIHQIENMSLVIEAAELLGVPKDKILEGLKNAKHPGRMEILRNDPILLYDGGHNPNGIAALTASIDRYAKGQKWNIIFAAMADKDITQSLKLLSPFCEKMFCTTVQNNPRAMAADPLCANAQALGITAVSVPTLSQAIALSKDAPTLICGSLYLYADLPKELRSL